MKTLGHRRQPQEASLWPNNISWWYLNEKLQELLSSSQLLLEPSIGQYCKHNIVAGCITCNLLYVYLMPYCVLCPLMVIFMILWHKGVKSGRVASMAFYFLTSILVFMNVSSQVGSFLKCPMYPVWLLGSETHLTVFFSQVWPVMSSDVPKLNNLES